MKNISRYERPEVRTLQAAELLEMIGPAQGTYLGGGGSGSVMRSLSHPSPGGTATDTTNRF